MTGIWRLRALVLVLVGALGVHEARYLLAPPDGHDELAAVHVYLVWLMPLAAGMLFVSGVQLAARARRSARPTLPSLKGLWLLASASLLAVFAIQEALELTFAHGHVPALPALAEHLGWQLIPLSVAVGGLIALLLKGAARIVVAALGDALRTDPGEASSRRPDAVLRVPRGSVLARKLAGRAPPVCS